ncbi:exported hypothetical protein [metagenome]
MKDSRLRKIAIVAVCFGLFVVGYAVSLIIQGYSTTETVKIEGKEFRLNQLTSLNLLPKSENPLPVQSLRINFDTLVIFQGDEVGVTAIATGVGSEVKAIAILFTKPSLDLYNMTNREIAKEIDESTKYRTTIHLLPNSNPPFTTRAMIPFLEPNQQVVIQVIVWTPDNYNKYLTKEIAFTVQPRTDKLQSETNQLILKQLEVSTSRDLQQDKTNLIFLGLGWIGIGIIPILGGIDVLLRIRFDSQQ